VRRLFSENNVLNIPFLNVLAALIYAAQSPGQLFLTSKPHAKMKEKELDICIDF
jgi:hypothetical protein